MVVTVPVTVLRVIRNRLELRTPPGLVATGVQERSGAELVPVRTTHIDTAAVQRFDLRTGRPHGEDENGDDDGTARIEVDLGYRLPDREFNDALKTAGLCMTLSLIAVFLMLASPALLSVIGTVLASLGVLVDIFRDRTLHDDNEPLHVHAGKRLRLLRQSNDDLRGRLPLLPGHLPGRAVGQEGRPSPPRPLTEADPRTSAPCGGPWHRRIPACMHS
ncbi:hypothetical protein SALBM135S_01880 [Streptomyces alboniger]